MDILQTIFDFKFLIGLFIPLGGWWIRRHFVENEIEKKRKLKEEEIKEVQYQALKELVLSIARDRILQGCRYHLDKGSVSAYEKANIETYFADYSKNGGNGFVHEVVEKFRQLPVNDSRTW